MTIPSPRLTASYPLHIQAVHPNIRLLEKAMKTDELRGLYLDFAVAAVTGFFEQVIMHHGVSLRPASVETVPSEAKWEPQKNRQQAESAFFAISGQSMPVEADIANALKSALMKRVGPECVIPVYEK